eukprot:7633710-Pyramimonas_sp.AAC.1
MRVELDRWYDSEEKRRKKPLTRVGDWTPGMIGTKTAPSLHLKGQETKWFTYFVVEHLLPTYKHKLPANINADVLLAAGRALTSFSNILDSQPRNIPIDVCKELQSLADLHVGLAEQSGVTMYPKHHLFRHLAAHICRKGNPRYYNTYWDET